MLHLCPRCQRSFEEAGRCPFDRELLVAASSPEAQTVEQRRATFPLTPQPAVALRAPDYDALVGQTLDGRYFVREKIGEGGMGVVFAARHAVIERPLAIKVLKREVMRDAATIRRFVQEAKAASRIGHPNIVDVTDFGTTPDGMTYSVMEYVAGQTLGAALRADAPFAMPRAVRIAAQIARALGAAHDKGIVHRDIKPENVFLVDRDGRPDFVKIVDFGIAKVMTAPDAPVNQPRLTRAGAVFGTPEYMAPEQAAGRGDTDGRIDIYALGVLLYEMVTGRVPHRGDSMVRTLAMQMLDPIAPPSTLRPDLSPEFEAVIAKALAKKRDHRYQTMGELLAALDGLQTTVGVSVTGSPVYALAPLPPGADPNLASLTSAPTQRRLRDEPQFATRDKPVTFDHVTYSTERPRAARRTWPVIALFALIFGGAVGVLALVAHSRRAAERAPEAPLRRNEAFDPIAVVATDAGIPGEPAQPDAPRAVIPARPGPVRVHTGNAPPPELPQPRAGRGTISIQVLTKPEGATLYAGTEYRGPAGANLEEAFGTTLELTCKHIGYKNGSVKLVFDGSQSAALCVLERNVVCIPGVKNPFDECPDE